MAPHSRSTTGDDDAHTTLRGARPADWARSRAGRERRKGCSLATAGLSNGPRARVISVRRKGYDRRQSSLRRRRFNVDRNITGAAFGRPLEEATFAGGCFWGVELAYQREPGVVSTEVGYAQGADEAPSYEAVCSGVTVTPRQFESATTRLECRTSGSATCSRSTRREPLRAQQGRQRPGTQYRRHLLRGRCSKRRRRPIARTTTRSGRPIVTEVENSRVLPRGVPPAHLRRAGRPMKVLSDGTIRCRGGRGCCFGYMGD